MDIITLKQLVMASMFCLPIELKQEVYSHLPDILSVVALSQTCHSFHLALSGIKSMVLAKVVQAGLVPLPLISIALDVAEAARLRPWTRSQVRNILGGLLTYKDSTDWTFAKAVFVATLQRDIDFFSDDFAATALDTLKTCAPTTADLALEWSEKLRIMRTFYIFELYRYLFRDQPRLRGQTRFTASEQHFFFAMFPPWQNEQLACVHDYLLRYISPGQSHA